MTLGIFLDDIFSVAPIHAGNIAVNNVRIDISNQGKII